MDELDRFLSEQLTHFYTDPIGVLNALATKSRLGAQADNELIAEMTLREFNKSEVESWLGLKEMTEKSQKKARRIISQILKNELSVDVPNNGMYRISMVDLMTLRDRLVELDVLKPIGVRANPLRKAIMIAIMQYKGGVGKTTMTLYSATHAATRGYRVLILDTDAQSSSSYLMGRSHYLNTNKEDSLYVLSKDWLIANPPEGVEVVKKIYRSDDGESIEKTFLKGMTLDMVADLVAKAIKTTRWPNIDIVSAHHDLFNMEINDLFVGENGDPLKIPSESIMQEIYKRGVFDAYDLVFFDTTPTINELTLSMLYASHRVIMPAIPERMVSWSIDRLFQYISHRMQLRKDRYGIKPWLKDIKIVPTLLRGMNDMSARPIIDQFKEDYGVEDKHIICNKNIYYKQAIAMAYVNYGTLYECVQKRTGINTNEFGLREEDDAALISGRNEALSMVDEVMDELMKVNLNLWESQDKGDIEL